MEKKIICIVAIIIVTLVAFMFGMEVGKMRTISNSTFFIVDYNSPITFNGIEYDTSLFIEIDGNVYEQGLFIG